MKYTYFLFCFLFYSCDKLKDYFPKPEPQPLPEFNKLYGGVNVEFSNALVATQDGGYLMAGASQSNEGDVSGNHGYIDVWLLKLDKDGNKLWQRCFGGSGADMANAIIRSQDGSYVMAGSTESTDGDVSGNHGNGDAWVVKVDMSGNLLWQKALGGSGSDRAYAITAGTGGGYVIAGSTTSNDGDVSGHHKAEDVWVIKLDNSGNIIWQNTLGGSRIDEARSITPAADGGYVIAGLTTSKNGDVIGKHGIAGTFDAWVVKLDKDGNLLWQKPLGGTGYDVALVITSSTDGGYIMGGMATSNSGDVSGGHGERDAWVVKMNAGGNIIWSKVFGGSRVDQVFSITKAKEDGYVMAGVTYSKNGDVSGNHGESDAWVFMINENGNLNWRRSLGGSKDDWAGAILTRTDDSFVIAAQTFSNDGDVSGNHGDSDAWVVTLKDQ
jgi:hypothetical protein